MRFFWSRVFQESAPHRPLMDAWKYFRIFFLFDRDIHEKEGTSADNPRKSEPSASYTVRQKGMPFRRIIRGKSKLSVDYTSESLLFLRNIPATSKQSSENFRRDNPRKVKTLRGLYCGKTGKIICGKSELSMDYPGESFNIMRKVKISLFKGLSSILKLISDKY